MTTAKAKHTKPVSKSGFYHCACHCVKSTYLAGTNIYTGVNFDHRAEWILSRLTTLCDLFLFDLQAYRIDHHQYDLILCAHGNAEDLSDEEVALRWLSVCPPKKALNLRGEIDTNLRAYQKALQDLMGDQEKLSTYRERLANLSWFMRFLNEYIARKANLEDKQTGSFWASRYRSQVIESEAALEGVLSKKTYQLSNPQLREYLRERLGQHPSTAETL